MRLMKVKMKFRSKWNSTKTESQFPWSPNLDCFLQDLGDNENNNY